MCLTPAAPWMEGENPPMRNTRQGSHRSRRGGLADRTALPWMTDDYRWEKGLTVCQIPAVPSSVGGGRLTVAHWPSFGLEYPTSNHPPWRLTGRTNTGSGSDSDHRPFPVTGCRQGIGVGIDEVLAATRVTNCGLAVVCHPTSRAVDGCGPYGSAGEAVNEMAEVHVIPVLLESCTGTATRLSSLANSPQELSIPLPR